MKLPTIAELREKRTLALLLEEHWRRIDDGLSGTEEQFEQFAVMVQVLFDEAHHRKALELEHGATPAADAWHATGWALLSDRSLAGAAFSYAYRAGTNAAISAFRHEQVERQAARRAGADPTLQDAGEPAADDTLREAFHDVLAGLDQATRELVVGYYRPGGPAALVDAELARAPTTTRGANAGAPRTRKQAALAIQKTVQRIRDLVGVRVAERSGIGPSTKTRPVSPKAEGGDE